MLIHLRKSAQRDQRYGLRRKEDPWTVTGIDYSTKHDHTFRTRREGSPIRFAEDQADTHQIGVKTGRGGDSAYNLETNTGTVYTPM